MSTRARRAAAMKENFPLGNATNDEAPAAAESAAAKVLVAPARKPRATKAKKAVEAAAPEPALAPSPAPAAPPPLPPTPAAHVAGEVVPDSADDKENATTALFGPPARVFGRRTRAARPTGVPSPTSSTEPTSPVDDASSDPPCGPSQPVGQRHPPPVGRREYTWLRRSLGRPPRRSQLFGPPGESLAAAVEKGPRTYARRPKPAGHMGPSDAELKALIEERSAYFAEVDAFQLIEEEEGEDRAHPTMTPAPITRLAADLAHLTTASGEGRGVTAMPTLAAALEDAAEAAGGRAGRRVTGDGVSLGSRTSSGGASTWMPGRLWQWAEAQVEAWANAVPTSGEATSTMTHGRPSVGGGRASDWPTALPVLPEVEGDVIISPMGGTAAPPPAWIEGRTAAPSGRSSLGVPRRISLAIGPAMVPAPIAPCPEEDDELDVGGDVITSGGDTAADIAPPEPMAPPRRSSILLPGAPRLSTTLGLNRRTSAAMAESAAVRALSRLSLASTAAAVDALGDASKRSPVPTVPTSSALPPCTPGGAVLVRLTPLEALLAECGQQAPGGGRPTIPTLDALVRQFAGAASGVRKLGEGTFGEAFRAGASVLKVVPMDGATVINGEVQRTCADYLGESVIAHRLSDLRRGLNTTGAGPPAAATSAFVETHRIAVCRGRYAPWLTAAWEAWDAKNGSENDHPKIFPPGQLYTVFCVADGGVDLEHFEVASAAEARSLLLQACAALAAAEEAVGFEHRDLHWGNVLLRRGGAVTARARLRGQSVALSTEGLTVTLIDFSLSRLDAPGLGSLHFDLEADPELFKGPKGDTQAEAYRRMRKATGGDWAGHHPKTNAIWIHYLADTLLTKKSVPMGAADKKALTSFRRAALAADSAATLLWDGYFTGLLNIVD